MRGIVYKRCGRCSRRFDDDEPNRLGCAHCGYRGFTYAYKTDLPRGPDGKRRQRIRSGFRTKRDAERELGRLVSRIQAGSWVEPGRKTVAEFSAEWLSAVRASLRYGGWEHYESRLRLYVVPTLGAVRLDRINPATLNALYADLLESGGRAGLAPRTVLHVHRTLHRMFEDAVRWGEVSRNPVRSADPPRVDRTEPPVWTAADLAGFLRTVADDRLVHVWTVLARTGMRRGEALGLRWDDVDVDDRVVTIRRAYVRDRSGYALREVKTDRSRRTIGLDDPTARAFSVGRTRLLEEQFQLGIRDVGWVAPDPDGNPTRPDWLSHRFVEICQAAGLPRIRLHDLRHTYATLGLEAGIDPRILADRLGHASTAVTQDIYQHVTARVERDAADRIGRAIDGP